MIWCFKTVVVGEDGACATGDAGMLYRRHHKIPPNIHTIKMQFNGEYSRKRIGTPDVRNCLAL